MAGDWIPMRTDLAEDPAVIGIADATGLDEGGVVGRLHRLWSWASWHTEDGDVKGVTLAWINRHVHSDGFAEAMVKVGWLVVTKSGVRFPRFDEWNSQSAKKRRLTARRMASLRANKSDATNVTKTSPQKIREENNTEEENTNTPLTPPRGEPPPEKAPAKNRPRGERTAAFERWYAVYPKRVGPDAAAKAFAAAMRRIEVKHSTRDAALEWLIAVTGEFATSPKGQGQFCWNPATFLNQGHYDDDRNEWKRGDGTDKTIGDGPGQSHSGDAGHW